jgi:hypothetical protein
MTVWLSLVGIPLPAQPAPDMLVARYQDNTTPYPLYAGCFSMQPGWTEADITNLARNFDALYGSAEVPLAVADMVRAINPRFSFLKYQGDWTVSGGDSAFVENGHREEILYYRVGNLAADVSGNETRFKLGDLLGHLLPSAMRTNTPSVQTNKAEFVTWLRVGTEYLKILGVQGDEITVARGLDGSKPAAYARGTPVIAPVLGGAPNTSSRGRFTYRHDPRSMLRWNSMLARLLQQHAANGSGIWIDILIGNFGQFALSGEPLGPERLWNLERNEPYAQAELARFTQRGVRFMQDKFKERTGQLPVIWGNNMGFPLLVTSARLQLLLTNQDYPRAVDGFAQENSFGQWGMKGNSGKEYTWTSLAEWITNTASIMFMGELQVAARPLAFDGGIDNLKFASLPAEERHRRLLYAYASYLIAVRVESDGRIYTALGLCPLTNNPKGDDPIEVDPSFLWDIGRPAETRLHTELDKYRLRQRDVFVRRFENGLVLVNPSEHEEAAIDLSAFSTRRLVNPDAGGKEVRSLALPAKSAAILLHAGPSSTPSKP